MTCPTCRTAGRVFRTLPGQLGVTRYYVCEQGHNWRTLETVTNKATVDRRQVGRLLDQQRALVEQVARLLGS